MEDDWKLQAERRINRMETRTAVDEVHRKAVETRLVQIEDNLRWLVRLVLGALLVTLVTFGLKGGFALPLG